MDLTHLLSGITLVLLLAVIASTACRHFNIPSILAYLFIGIITSPHAFNFLPDKATHELAEFGVVFLMFTIGLEFSWRKMLKMKHLVFGLGGAQIFFTVVVCTLLSRWAGLSMPDAIAIGCIISMSSTAIVSKQLQEQHELNTAYGKNVIAILFMQDLAAIPFLILISKLTEDSHSLLLPLGFTVLKTIAAFIFIFMCSRWLIRPLFRLIAKMYSIELFTLATLTVVLGAAWSTHFLNLSLPLGAFLAGMILGESEFRHQTEAAIRPFRDILLGLFFISIGMLFNVNSLLQSWHWILLGLISLFLIKTIIVTLVSWFVDKKFSTALRTGLLLAQGGEFGFVILTIATQNGLLDPPYNQIVLATLLFSMALTPLVIRHNSSIINFLIPNKKHKQQSHQETLSQLNSLTHDLHDHVIICGYGHTGQTVARILEVEHIDYVATELDLTIAENAKRRGHSVVYGDAALSEIITACGVKKARAVVITFDKIESAIAIIENVRLENKHVPIFVRAHNETHIEALQHHGATEVIPVSLETSLTLAAHLLVSVGIPSKKVNAHTEAIRKSHYRLFYDAISHEKK